jgi:hypothetical protein
VQQSCRYKGVLDPRATVREAVALLRDALLKKRIALRLELADGLPSVRAVARKAAVITREAGVGIPGRRRILTTVPRISVSGA